MAFFLSCLAILLINAFIFNGWFFISKNIVIQHVYHLKIKNLLYTIGKVFILLQTSTPIWMVYYNLVFYYNPYLVFFIITIFAYLLTLKHSSWGGLVWRLYRYPIKIPFSFQFKINVDDLHSYWRGKKSYIYNLAGGKALNFANVRH